MYFVCEISIKMSRGGAGGLVSVAKADILTGNNRHIITLTITSVIACHKILAIRI